MVLKRILVTALSALGLGALAAGTASGQTAGDGNIPAPGIFDDQIACTMLLPDVGGMMAINTPSRVAGGAMQSELDRLIGMGRNRIENSVADTAGFGYVIPDSHCGGRGGGTLGDDNSSVTIDVAEGYSALLPLFEVVYGNPGATSGGTSRALAAAQKNLREAIEDGLPASEINRRQNVVTQAQETHNMALARFNSAAGGPVYQAGVAEWMAKAAVTKSLGDYNTQVDNTNEALRDLDALAYDSYVPLGNSDLITAVFKIDTDTGMDAIHTDALEAYNGALLTEEPLFAEVTDNGVTTSDESNFDQTGKLIVPMQYYEPNGSPSADQANPSDDAVLRPVTVAGQIGDGGTPGEGIRYVVERTRAAAAALKELRDENVVTSVQSVYNDAYARAQAEADYYNDVWNRMLADNTDLRTADQKGDTNRDGTISAEEQTAINNGLVGYVADPITIAGRAAAHRTESNKRETAEQGLRAAVVAREQATDAVVAAFSSPQSFYEQLVARRQALKATADKAVADATPVGGVVPEGLTDAQDDAAKALANAEKARDELLALFEDEDDPTVALINELVKNNGDDGQALVDAISATYETAAGAADAAREVVNELTGDDGAVSANTADIKTNSDAIATNAEGIATNAEGIATNAEGIATNAEGIATNAEGIATNAEGIATNAEGIMANSGRIDTNAGNIMTNAGNIMTNADNIMANSGRIDSNADSIMTNAGNIMTNADNIMANSGRIDSNADAIAANMNSIGSNSSAISDNRNMIGELSEDLETVRAGVAASMALAGMPAINGRGISIGVGSFDGESAFAVGFQIQGEQASFKVGVTSASGATGASAGVGFQF